MKTPQKKDGSLWDWDKFAERRSFDAFQFHIDNWDKPITEAEYIAFNMGRVRAGKRLPPSKVIKNAKHDYHRLKNDWGFFKIPPSQG